MRKSTLKLDIRVAAITETGVLKLQNLENYKNNTFSKYYQPMFDNNKVAYTMLWKNSKGVDSEFFSCSPKPKLNNDSIYDFKAFLAQVTASLLSAFRNNKIYKSALILFFILFSLLAKAQYFDVDSVAKELSDTSPVDKTDINKVRVIKNKFVYNKVDTFTHYCKIQSFNNDCIYYCLTDENNRLEIIIQKTFCLVWKNRTKSNPYGKTNMIVMTILGNSLQVPKKIKLLIEPTLLNIAKLIFSIKNHQHSQYGYSAALNPEKIEKLIKLYAYEERE